jgi:hypothetical protein
MKYPSYSGPVKRIATTAEHDPRLTPYHREVLADIRAGRLGSREDGFDLLAAVSDLVALGYLQLGAPAQDGAP